MFRRILFAAALLAAVAVQTPAQAQWGYGGYGFGGFGTNYFGYGLPAGWYTGVQGRMPPYFALHPPVYYSGEIIRIPYGSSPFACPMGMNCGWNGCTAPAVELPAAPMTPAKPDPESVMVENEFVKRPQICKAQGLMIENPFYQPSAKLAQSE